MELGNIEAISLLSPGHFADEIHEVAMLFFARKTSLVAILSLFNQASHWRRVSNSRIQSSIESRTISLVFCHESRTPAHSQQHPLLALVLPGSCSGRIPFGVGLYDLWYWSYFWIFLSHTLSHLDLVQGLRTAWRFYSIPSLLLIVLCSSSSFGNSCKTS